MSCCPFLPLCCLCIQPYNHPDVPDKCYEAWEVRGYKPEPNPTKLLVLYHAHDERFEDYERWVPLKQAYTDFSNIGKGEAQLVVLYASMVDKIPLYKAVAVAACKKVSVMFPMAYKKHFEKDEKAKHKEAKDKEREAQKCQYNHSIIDTCHYQPVAHPSYFRPGGEYTEPSHTTRCRQCHEEISDQGAKKPTATKPVWVCLSIEKRLPCAPGCLHKAVVCHACQKEYLQNQSLTQTARSSRRSKS